MGLSSAGSRTNPVERAAPCVIKVVILDGHALTAQAVARTLDADPALAVVGIAGEPLLAEQVVRRTSPDVVLLHDPIDGMPAMSLARRLAGAFPGLKLLILAMDPTHERLRGWIEAGAVGQVRLDQPLDELIAAVKRVHAGEALFEAEALLRLLTRPAPPPAPPAERLGPREREVLQALASGQSTAEVAAALRLSVHTVRSHLKNSMAKLGVHSKLEAILVATKKGLIELS